MTMLGKTISHYTVLEELYRSDRQVVYRARDDRLQREVALKVLPSDLVTDPDRRKRLFAEAKAAAALEHPHIGVIHEIDEADGVAFIAMELLRGPSLAKRLEDRGKLPLSEALDVAVGVAAALVHAHERGIVHRDLKPANVVLTEDGHPKLIDFGLAKLLDVESSPFLGEAGEDEAPLASTTREEVIAGTVAFMSPEQARGGRVDARSDVFSFGLLLYTMLAGEPPFVGTSRIDTLHATLHEPTPKLPGLSGEERQRLQPIFERCLEKEPDRRYQSTSELLEDLRRARRELESGGGGRLRRYAVAAALALAALVASLALLFRSETPAAPPAKPSLAVLHFENLSGDAELDWLRTGLTDMLVTDLSQSPDIEVLDTAQLHQVLEDMGRSSSAMMSSDAIEELSSRTGVDKVLVGSFAKAGDAIRLSARVQDARTGQVLFSEKVEATGEQNVFRLVDEITRKVEANFGLAPPGDKLDRDLRDVTTSSVEAYREYAEGIRLHERFREEEAVPHFQRAVELDPGFAMALAKLGVVLSNLGMHEEADVYAERALEHVDRLSARERYYIEGWYYSRDRDTLGRAIEAYEQAIDVYPDHGSARHNLGNLLFSVERYDEAIEVLEVLRRRRMVFPGTYEQLAIAYKVTGDIDEAIDVLDEYQERHPDDWTTLVSEAQILVETGDIEDGLELLDRAEGLGATALRIAPVRWEARIFLEDWDGALEAAASMEDAGRPAEKLLGGKLAATTALYRGEYSSIVRDVARMVSDAEGNETYLGPALAFQARLFLDAGEDARALETALAVDDGDERFDVARLSKVIGAIAARRLGDAETSERLVRDYGALAGDSIGPGPERLHQFLLGELALADGHPQQAIRHLNEAESMLPPRGTDGIHTVIWYALATAHREAGNANQAISWYERIVESTEERVFEPVRYVRSFYFLARLQEAEGELDDAEESYARFLEHWAGGELDRDRVLEARARLAALSR